MSVLSRSAGMFALAVSLLAAAAAPAPAACPSDGSEFWIVNTRGAAVQCDAYAPIESLRVSVCLDGAWIPAGMEVLLATSGVLPAVVYIHGNGLDEEEALDIATDLYEGLLKCAPCPFRFILWAWPADLPGKSVQQRVQLHSRQADYEGFIIARMVEKMIPGPPISIAGHSLGAITVGSSMHHLGGGALGARVLAAPISWAYDVRAVLIAGAVDNDLLLPGRRYEMALNRADRFVVFKNPSDRILPHWPKLSERGAEAMGYTGALTTPAMGPALWRLEHIITTPYVGSKHSSPAHYDSPEILSILCCIFFSPRRFPPLYFDELPGPELPRPELPLPGTFGPLRSDSPRELREASINLRVPRR